MDTFEAKLAELSRRFLDRALRKSAILQAFASDVECEAQAASRYMEIQRIAHDLSGGATFGFERIGVCAVELDALIFDSPNSSVLAGACRALSNAIVCASK